MAKKLIINCGNCDTRFVQEDTLAAYESIIINCGDVLVSPESKALLNQYNVTMNCGNTKELGKDVKVKTINGKYQIRSSDAIGEEVYLSVNGKLEIGPDTQEVLRQYVGIYVNGKAIYPESVGGALSGLQVNGKTVCYPDGAIVLNNNTAIDRTFALRAKEKLYWAEKRLIMVDPRMDPGALAKKGASFCAEEVIIAEGLVEDLIDRIDERAEIVIVPDGTAVVADDLKLNDGALLRYGTKLCVLGDLEVAEDAGEVLEKLEYLMVRGDAAVPEELHETLLKAAAEITGEVKVMKKPKGRVFREKLSLRLSKWLLEQETDGVSVVECVDVRLDADIPNELILEKLEFSHCVNVHCTPDQEAAVAAVAEDVISIGEDEDEAERGGIGGMMKDIFGTVKGLTDTKVINAGDYVL